MGSLHKASRRMLPPLQFPEVKKGHLQDMAHTQCHAANRAASVSTRCPAAQSHYVGVGSRVMLRSLQTRQGLNGMLGTCVWWNDFTERWEVKLDSTSEKLSVRLENLVALDHDSNERGAFAEQDDSFLLHPRSMKFEQPMQQMLASNNGWRGKTVHTWMFGDAQENV